MRIIYFDENYAPTLAHGMHHINQGLRNNYEVRHLNDDFEKGTKDEDWIQSFSNNIMITQDFNIQRTRQQKKQTKKET